MIFIKIMEIIPTLICINNLKSKSSLWLERGHYIEKARSYFIHFDCFIVTIYRLSASDQYTGKHEFRKICFF